MKLWTMGITHLMQPCDISNAAREEKIKTSPLWKTHRQSLHWYPPRLLTSPTSTGRPIDEDWICCLWAQTWLNAISCYKVDALYTGVANQVSNTKPGSYWHGAHQLKNWPVCSIWPNPLTDHIKRRLDHPNSVCTAARQPSTLKHWHILHSATEVVLT